MLPDIGKHNYFTQTNLLQKIISRNKKVYMVETFFLILSFFYPIILRDKNYKNCRNKKMALLPPKHSCRKNRFGWETLSGRGGGGSKS